MAPDVAKSPPKSIMLVLRLYVTGIAPNSLRAIAKARTICGDHFPGRHELEIVDVIEEPLRALVDGVVVTPTLLKLSPPPVQRMVGNLSDTQRVLDALGLASDQPA